MKYYKFLRTGLKSENGGTRWKIGEWKKYRGKLQMCKAGFHCSEEPYDAFSYVQGEIFAEVEYGGIVELRGVLVRFNRDHDAYNLVILPRTRIRPVSVV